MNRILLGAIFILSLTACAGNSASRDSGLEQTGAAAVKDAGIAPKATEGDRILVSKGVIRSDNEVSVFSRITGQLNEVRLIDGQKVRKGEVLFTLDDSELKAKVELCEAELEQAELMLEDILIGQGYKKGNMENVPENVYKLAWVKSGCNVKEKELEIAEYKLESANIKAPLSGVIANMSPTSYAYVNPGETLCKIIDTQSLIVEFSILETELRRFEIGSEVQVSSISYSEKIHKAVVRSIGSLVDETGMVKVEAVLKDTDRLLPGMTAIIKL